MITDNLANSKNTHTTCLIVQAKYWDAACVFSSKTYTECSHVISLVLQHCSRNLSPSHSSSFNVNLQRLDSTNNTKATAQHMFTSNVLHPSSQHFGLAFNCSRWHERVKNLEPLKSWFSQKKNVQGKVAAHTLMVKCGTM